MRLSQFMIALTTAATLALSAGAAVGMVTLLLPPPKVTTRSLPATMPPLPLASATCTAPIVTGAAPYSFVRRMRSVRPPVLRRTTWRIVWSLKLRVVPPTTGSTGCCGAAAQL